MLDPTTQASKWSARWSGGGLVAHRVLTDTAHTGHDPSSRIVIERHLRFLRLTRSTLYISKQQELQNLEHECNRLSVLSVIDNQLENSLRASDSRDER